MVRTMRSLTSKPLDVHLMVDRPQDFVAELAALGAERVSVHAEVPGGPGEALAAIRAAGMQAGLVLNPETPLETATPYLPQIGQLLLMTVQPGRGGQPLPAGQQRPHCSGQGHAANRAPPGDHPGGRRHHGQNPARRLPGGSGQRGIGQRGLCRTHCLQCKSIAVRYLNLRIAPYSKTCRLFGAGTFFLIDKPQA